MFESEADLLAQLAHHDALVRQCVCGEITFTQFCDSYNNFFFTSALDGHESDDEESALLEKHEPRVRPHRAIALDILSLVCAEEDASLESYRQAGRFGPIEAVARLARVEVPVAN